MRVIKKEGYFGTAISFDEKNKSLRFAFGGNGDLYWSIHSKSGNSENTFVITKENYGVYELFDELFSDIENINIFDYDIPFYIENEEKKDGYFRKRKAEIECQKSRYRLYNYSNYNELYDNDNKIITWYSDETNHKVSNILKIKQVKDSFRIEFYTQLHIEGYDEDFHSDIYIPIRFRNSGSFYGSFNIVFMKMYNNMKNLDDVNDMGHQIHIEEYLYSKKILMKKK